MVPHDLGRLPPSAGAAGADYTATVGGILLVHGPSQPGEDALLSGLPNVFLGNPLPYDELVFLMSQSFLILTDSGGIQEEAPSLNVPLLVMRDTTERPEGIDAGCAVLVGTDKMTIVNTFQQLSNDEHFYKSMARAENPYGDGTTALQIIRILKEINR